MLANWLEFNSKGLYLRLEKEKENRSPVYVFTVLRTRDKKFLNRSRATTAKICTKTGIREVQSYLVNLRLLLFCRSPWPSTRPTILLSPSEES